MFKWIEDIFDTSEADAERIKDDENQKRVNKVLLAEDKKLMLNTFCPIQGDNCTDTCIHFKKVRCGSIHE